MLTTKTQKALCLSLLVSLTAQISAEGWYEKLKSWVTPGTVLTAIGAALVGTGLYQYHQYKSVPVQELVIQTPNGIRSFNVNGYGFTAQNWLVHNGAMHARATFTPQTCSGSITGPRIRNSHLCNFQCKYTIDDANQELRTVDFSDFGSFPYRYMRRSTFDIQTSPLAAYLYSLRPENDHKSQYAQTLAIEVNTTEVSIEQKNAAIDRLYDKRTALMRTHTRVTESLN